MYLACTIVLLVILSAFTIHKRGNWVFVVIPVIASVLISLLIITIDYNQKTSDTEVWSGRVVDWDHEEEWDEWIDESCSTNSDGVTSCTPGYWKHHYATNRIKTSDNGWIAVKRAPDGTKFNDSYPNRTQELLTYWPANTPSASTHTYLNKVQASYSIYRHKGIDVKYYKELPEYPKDEWGYIHINRILGDVPNKPAALQVLDDTNSALNKFIPDPEKEGKMRSWKQVNLIFVNVGTNKPEQYGFALQDKWEGGNKNDFVVSFSLDENNNVLWVYPFSWSESELLKIEVRDYFLDLKHIDDFVPVVDKVSGLVADMFVRKQFADFNYLQIDVSKGANIVILIFQVIIGITALFLHWRYIEERDLERRYRRRY